MTSTPTVHETTTPSGPARLHVDGPKEGCGLLVLGHGAGGGVEAVDLLAARDAGLAAGFAVVRVEQPWRVRGRRVAEPPARLDIAWLAACRSLLPACGPLVLGGRSAGARVACRTAGALVADGVLALAFPLHPPSRPARSRLAELQLPQVRRLVVQGDRDCFGMPPSLPGVQVHAVAGADHAFAVRRRDQRSAADVAFEVQECVGRWLAGLGGLTSARPQPET